MSITFLNGDCLQVMKDLSGGSIDCFVCDLPYGCLGNDRRSEKVKKDIPDGGTYGACIWDIKIDLDEFWKQVKRLAKSDNTPVLMFCTTKFGAELIASNPSWFRYDLVWDKGRGVSFLSANKMPMRSHEMIYIFSKSGAYYNRKDITGDFKQSGGGRDKGKTVSRQYGATGVETTNSGTRCVLSVIHASAHKKGGHPTEKPLDLYKWLLERYCPPGGTILDPTAGSFNSCFAAYDLGLHAIGIEKDDGFYSTACKKMDLE